MKVRLIIFLSLLLGVGLNVELQAQSARSILDKASDAYNKAGAIQASFSLNVKDAKGQTTYSYQGKAQMKGDKFRIEIPDGITWFDGKTQWVYLKESDEVNITIPTGEELQAISPAAMFNSYKKGYNLKSNGSKTVRGKTVYEVEMTPQKKNDDIRKIVVQIDKVNNIFSSITMIDRSGNQNILTVTSLQTKANIPESRFVFEKKEYPQSEIIDLR